MYYIQKEKYNLTQTFLCFIFLCVQISATNQAIFSPKISFGHFSVSQSSDRKQHLNPNGNLLNDNIDDINDNIIDDDITLEDIIKYENEHVVKNILDEDTIKEISTALSAIVKKPLWQNTIAPRGRDALYLLPHKLTAIEYGGLSFNIFVNKIDKLHVSAGSLFELGSAINQQALNGLIEILIERFSFLNNVSAEELTSLLALFNKITIQERKAGILMQGGVVSGPFVIQLQTSLLASERNFWINKKVQEGIKNITQKIFPGQSFDQSEGFIARYGMGDTKIKIGLNSLNTTNIQADVGFETVFPTSRFSKQKNLTTSVEQIINEPCPSNPGKAAIQFLREIRDYLLTPMLGNGGHFGFGIYGESKIGIFNNLAQLWFRLSYDKLFDNQQDVLMMFKPVLTPEELEDNNKAEKLKEFLQQYIIPTPFTVTLNPGGVFNFVASVSIGLGKFQLALGYDFYSQQRQRIKSLEKTSISSFDLRVDDAEAPRISQQKAYTEFSWLKQYKRVKLGVGLGGDITVRSTGLGHDWTMYLRITTSF